jgi:surfeit locus 1 family protein
MAQSQATKPLSKAGIAFFSSLCATTFGLGCWQAQRYYEKIDMIEARNQESLMEPQALEKNAKCSIAEQQGVREDKITQRGFGPITVQGEFAHQYEILIGPRGPPPGAISSSGPNSGRSSGGMSSSPQGYYVITPLKRNFGMGTVLVNRGWVPRQYVLQNAAWDRPNGTVNIVGVASKTERKLNMNIMKLKLAFFIDKFVHVYTLSSLSKIKLL